MASWFTEGNVAVTNGSTIVTGTNTKFSNCRVGDMFVGPDSGIYQVTNPSSDTAVSISPAYRGPSTAGAVYGIVPVNGYPKLLADAVNQMVLQWGATLAGLGTVSTENVVPVAKGGTGGTNAAAARSGLGLGTSATAAAGTAAGNVMPVGAFGLGRQFDPGLSRVSDVSGVDIYSTGFYRYDVNTSNRPGFGSGYGSLIELSALQTPGANYGGQIALDYTTPEMGFRCLAGASGFSAWRKIYHDGNTTRAADGTLKAI